MNTKKIEAAAEEAATKIAARYEYLRTVLTRAEFAQFRLGKSITTLSLLEEVEAPELIVEAEWRNKTQWAIEATRLARKE